LGEFTVSNIINKHVPHILRAQQAKETWGFPMAEETKKVEWEEALDVCSGFSERSGHSESKVESLF
jgi:hypothetical protein